MGHGPREEGFRLQGKGGGSREGRWVGVGRPVLSGFCSVFHWHYSCLLNWSLGLVPKPRDAFESYPYLAVSSSGFTVLLNCLVAFFLP